MKPLSPETERRFVFAMPWRSGIMENARVLERQGWLRLMALGTRRGVAGIPPERTRLYPLIGLLAYAGAKTLPPFRAESFRYRLLPLFDRWALKQLQPGDHVVSSYGFTNECFKRVRLNGGKTFLEAGNSHLKNFWEIISEEHHRWNCPLPPMPPYWFARSMAMLAETDYVLSPSAYVTNSFLARGFKPEQILRNIYPLDLSLFLPARELRPATRPLTLICTGSLSLRKGTPYLLEAVRLVQRKIPGVRLRLKQFIEDSIRPILAKYPDLPIEWLPYGPYGQVAEYMRESDIFILPSLEDGFAFTVAEAMACGLPVVTTPNTGASDLVQPGVNGEVVPIRDPQAIADAVFKWAEKILAPGWQPRVLANLEPLSFEHFESVFLGQLQKLGLI